MPAVSFPQVFSGNPGSFLSVPSFVCPCMGKILDSRLKTSGMTEGDVGNDRGHVGRDVDMSEGMSDLTEGKAGMTEGEGVPDFVGIAGSAVILVFSCHACRVPPLSFPLGSLPSYLPVSSLTGVFLSGGRGVRRFGGKSVIVFHPTGYVPVKRQGCPRHVQARQGFP